ncbi:MAG: glutamate synthase [Clostridia bacterium]|nr:glutamate synthase [Clostridia bacterium]
MTVINAHGLDYKEINESIREADTDITIDNCLGQRFIADGMSNKRIVINGVPGNALGAYLNGAVIEVNANAQDAVGDTMNAGKIIIHGSVGDAVGYAMRGGEIYVKENAGYRAGIHMKAYKEKQPVMVIGGRCGSFLGEYQAGGTIIVLGLNKDGKNIVSNFPSTGMHGGKIFLRGKCDNIKFPSQVKVTKATKKDIENIKKYVTEFCLLFGYDENEILNSYFTVITPDSKNPYKQMYVAN